MKNRFFRGLRWSTVCFCALFAGGPAWAILPVIPAPLKAEQGNGAFQISGTTAFYTTLKGEEKKLLEGSLGSLPFKLKAEDQDRDKNILSLLLTEHDPDLPSPESYRLVVSPDKLTITATGEAGLFYGLQTVLQMASPVSGTSVSVPSVVVTDTPHFGYRGLMIDVSRHFFPIEFLKKQIDAMAFYKLNRLHLHLTDGAGWRVEIKKYPLLTELAAWRKGKTWKDWVAAGAQYVRFDDPEAQGGFYTQDQLRDLVAYAQARFITIIPEIEMPGHTEEVLAAYPELSCSGKPYTEGSFCVGKEEVFTFLEDVLTEVMDIFPSEYIHIGGDEAPKEAWKTDPASLKLMEKEGIDGMDGLQSYFIHRIEVFLNSKGRQLLGWDEILEGGLAPNAAVMSWRGEQGGIEAAKAGHPVIMTPGESAYISRYQDAPQSQPLAGMGYLPLKKVYAYNPIPDVLSVEEARFIKGVQISLWTEHVPTPEHAEYMIYPRLLALAEVAWTAPERKSYDDFRSRAVKAVATLQSKGYHPFDLSQEIGSRPESLQPVAHLALGKPVTYNAPYSPSYTAKGDATLTDGLRGDWIHHDGNWQGFADTAGLDITIDLGSVTTVHYIGADFMQPPLREVFLPVRIHQVVFDQIAPLSLREFLLPTDVDISVSDDGITFTNLSRQTFPVKKSGSFEFRTVAWEGETKARYIRYAARLSEELQGWVLTDEIIVK